MSKISPTPPQIGITVGFDFVFFLYMFFGEPAVHFSHFFPLLPLTEVSPRPSAIPGGNPPGDGQSAVGWGDAGFEPGTAGQQSGTLPLSHHASRFCRKVYMDQSRKSISIICLIAVGYVNWNEKGSQERERERTARLVKQTI